MNRTLLTCVLSFASIPVFVAACSSTSGSRLGTSNVGGSGGDDFGTVGSGVTTGKGSSVGVSSGGAGSSVGGASTTSTSPFSSSTSLSSTAASTFQDAAVSSTTSFVASSTSSSTGSGGAGNHTFATATPIVINDTNPTSGSLPDPTSSLDYYSFTGTKGQAIVIVVEANALTGSGNSSDPTVIDTAITLYNANQTQIAQDDDPFPFTSTDAVLFTILPESGTYYVKIDDCNAQFDPTSCADPSAITTFDYDVGVEALSAGPSTTPEAAEPNATEQTAATVSYSIPQGGTGYGLTLLYGTLQSSSDVDVFGFVVPTASTPQAGARSRVDLFVQSSGASDGDGSTVPPGKIWIVDPTAPAGKMLGELDDFGYGDAHNATNAPADLSVPITLGKQYYLFVQHAAEAALGTNDFYFIENSPGLFGNPFESTTAHATFATSEALAPQDNGDGTTSYFIDGDLPVPTSPDYFSAPVPAGTTQMIASCSAQRTGSGLRSLSYSVVRGSDGVTVLGSATEGPAADSLIAALTFPNTETSLILRVAAGSQDPTVTAASYECGMTFAP